MAEAYWKANLSGATCPWKVGAVEADGTLRETDYVLKNFRTEEDIPRLLEFLAGRFCYELGLNSPPVELLDLTADYLDSLASVPGRASLANLAEPGRHVSFMFIDEAGPLCKQPEVLNHLERPAQIGEIVGFDTLVHNHDRHSKNILVVPASAGGRPKHRLVPIDFGSSFVAKVRPSELESIVDLTEILVKMPLSMHLRSSDDFDAVKEKLTAWSGSTARVQALISWVPPEWNVPQQWLRGLGDHILRRIDVTLHALETSVPRNIPDFQLSLNQGVR